MNMQMLEVKIGMYIFKEKKKPHTKKEQKQKREKEKKKSIVYAAEDGCLFK